MFVVHDIVSNQTGPHPRLEDVVGRHLHHEFRRPPGEPTRVVFRQLEPPAGTAVILDLGCGDGESSLKLALSRPDAWVLGIDKSEHRLDKGQHKHGELPANLRLLRADAIDFVLLAQQNGWRCEKICLFYPNPWPKSEHLQRRWHGHAVFPHLLRLSDQLELRTNWQIYAQEFAYALQLAQWQAELQPWQPEDPLTAFERKYAAAGQQLWRLLARPA